MKTKKERIYKWDNIKAILIILVVIGHFIDIFITKSEIYKSIYLYIYSFHMPLFIFISGYMSKNLIKNCNKNKLTNRLLIYFFLGFLLKFMISITKGLNGTMSFQLLEDKSAPWFLFVIAMFILTTYFIQNKKFFVILIFSMLLSVFVGYDKSVKDLIYLSRYIVFFPFFWCGFKLNVEKIVLFLKNKYVKVILILFMVILGILTYLEIDNVYMLRGIFTARKSYFSLGIMDSGIVIRMVYYVLSAIMSLGIISIVPDKRIPLISNLGSRTLPVYLFHCPVLYLMKYLNFHSFIFRFDYINWQITWLAIAIVTALLLSSKPFNSIIDFITNNIQKNDDDIYGDA